MEERVQKIIANAGLCSRRKAEQLIIDGLVKVNDKIIHIGDKADLEKDSILVEDKPICASKKMYLAFNKPANCITTLSDPQGRRTIFEYLNFDKRLIPIGRLDSKTEGLLLLTNDGDFANHVMHPRYEVEKTYIVTLDKSFPKEGIDVLNKGIDIDGQRTAPAKVKYSDSKKYISKTSDGTSERTVIEITIHEGRNRIVRRMMKKLGFVVERLVRISIGDVKLGDLQPSKYRDLSKDEISSLMKK